MEALKIILLTAAICVRGASQDNIDKILPPKLSIESKWKSFYQTEKVTLKCSVDQDSNRWTYEWFRDGVQLPKAEDIYLSRNTLSISSAKLGHSGVYTCKGKHLTRMEVPTSQSKNVQLRIYGVIPKPQIKKRKWFKPFYTGEKIQISCERIGVFWEYKWYRIKESIETEIKGAKPTFNINSASLSDTGGYLCKAKRGNLSVESETLQMQIQQLPLPHIQSEWIEAFPGEKVSMQCVLQDTSENWIYLWFRGSVELVHNNVTSIKGNNLTLSVQSNHYGEYECQAELKGRMVKTAKSKTQSLTVHASQPTIILKQDPAYPELYTGEQVKLHCSIQEQMFQWEYLWQKDSGDKKVQVNSDLKNPVYTISSAVYSDNGSYSCQVKTRGVQFSSTEFINLVIREPPQPKLSIESEWKSFYQTEKVTLKCSVDGESNEWGYEWLRDAVQLPNDESISLSGNTLSISSASIGHSGVYSCKGKHLTRTPVTTAESENMQLRVDGVMPKPRLEKHEWFKPFYAGEKIQLDCDMSGVGWEYSWYKVKES
ncbi:basement membrane-specific heparan sulfate proteoglycan core protein [Danio aesculapii]|uniref:basement membrane-specific heparan sulfate proteoglycan core protein n=1 Tax=Danio aesculapii TaxID=1142201 RepID=UPI0024BFEEA2|nr:basement membrane-specific heparan sulfate proteoglycan core protein [Danio aesculapii]XP_056305373.1 basement membrane-specific heparan sulfate proteoglycan core protein [Danio aesculapii]